MARCGFHVSDSCPEGRLVTHRVRAHCVTALSCIAVGGLAACTGDAGPEPAPLADRLWAVEWVAGGGDDPGADSPAELFLPEGQIAVARDGALWAETARVSDLNDLDGVWRAADRVTRIDRSGAVMRVELDFLDMAHLDGAQPSDVPTVASGPVSWGDAGVLVVVTGGTNDRQWYRTYSVDAAGGVELWEPSLPAGFVITDLLDSTDAHIRVIGTSVSEYEPSIRREFVVDEATMMAAEDGTDPEPEAPSADTSDPPFVEPLPPLVIDKPYQRIDLAAARWGALAPVAAIGDTVQIVAMDVDVPSFGALVPRVEAVPTGNRSQAVVDWWATEADAWKLSNDPTASMPMSLAVVPDSVDSGTGTVVALAGGDVGCSMLGVDQYVCGSTGKYGDSNVREMVLYRVTVTTGKAGE